MVWTQQNPVAGLDRFANVLQTFVSALDNAMRFSQVGSQPEPKQPRQPATAIRGNKFVGLFNNNFVHRAEAVFLRLKNVVVVIWPVKDKPPKTAAALLFETNFPTLPL